MKFVDINQLKRQLDFQPQKAWPSSMPCFAWKEQMLCGFDRSTGQAIEIQEPLTEILIQLYPQLHLSELARAYIVLESFFSTEEMTQWLSHYGFRSSERCKKFFHLIQSLPAEFSKWSDQKQLGINDLAVLFCFKDLKEFHPVLRKIASDSLSKSQGVQMIELAGELWLAEKQSEVIETLKSESSHHMLSELKRLRYPVTTERHNDRKSRLSQIAWPKGTSAHLQQKGDANVVELKILTSGAEELSRQLEQLSRLTESQKGDWL